MTLRLIKHPKFLYRPEINIKAVFKEMTRQKVQRIPSNLNFKNYRENRNEFIKYILSMNGIFRFKTLTAYKAIFYLDFIMFQNEIEKKYFPAITLSCYILSTKYCENDPNVPSVRKFCEVFYKVSKKFYLTTIDINKSEVFCLAKLGFDLHRYTLYDFVSFCFVHGILEENFDKSNLSTKIKKLEKIYNKAREIIDYLLLVQGEFVFENSTFIISKTVLKVVVENLIGKEHSKKIDRIYPNDPVSSCVIDNILKNIKIVYDKFNSKKQKISRVFSDQNIKSASKTSMNQNTIHVAKESNAPYKIIKIVKCENQGKNKKPLDSKSNSNINSNGATISTLTNKNSFNISTKQIKKTKREKKEKLIQAFAKPLIENYSNSQPGLHKKANSEMCFTFSSPSINKGPGLSYQKSNVGYKNSEHNNFYTSLPIPTNESSSHLNLLTTTFSPINNTSTDLLAKTISIISASRVRGRNAENYRLRSFDENCFHSFDPLSSRSKERYEYNTIKSKYIY